MCPGEALARVGPARVSPVWGGGALLTPRWPVHWEPVAPGASQPALHSSHCLRWGFYSEGRAISPNRAGRASPDAGLRGILGAEAGGGGGQGQAEGSGSAREPLPPHGARPRRGRGCRFAGSTWKQSW